MDIGLFDSVFFVIRSERPVSTVHTRHLQMQRQVDVSADVDKNDLHNVRLVWRAITDRRNLFRIAPHSVPLALRIPTYPLKYITGAWSLFCSDLIGRTLRCARHSKTHQKWTWRSSDPILICRVLSITHDNCHRSQIALCDRHFVLLLFSVFFAQAIWAAMLSS